MPTTREEWKQVHAELMAKLKLPCKLKFSYSHPVGGHVHAPLPWRMRNCYIEINPNADFRVPAHLILHEAAHHRHHAGFLGSCSCRNWWHCEHWAQELCRVYEETGIALPRTTGFAEFAKAVGIVHKVFSPDEVQQSIAIAENTKLVEGE
jgi:hypothetical protein